MPHIDDKKVINFKMTSIPAENREIPLFLKNFSHCDTNDNSLAVKVHYPVSNLNVMLNKSTKSS